MERKIVNIEINKIIPNKNQPRRVFEDQAIEELSKSIQENGLLQPIVVRQKKNKYEIIAGERRYRACKLLNLETINCIIQEVNDNESAQLAIIENIQRENLTAIEEAQAYLKLMELNNYTQEQLAEKLGKSQSSIANKIRLINLPKFVKDAISERQITERHARALLSLEEKNKIKSVYNQIIKKGLNVKQTEELVAAKNGKENKEPKKKVITHGITQDVRIARNTVLQALNMIKKTGVHVELVETNLENEYQMIVKIKK